MDLEMKQAEVVSVLMKERSFEANGLGTFRLGMVRACSVAVFTIDSRETGNAKIRDVELL
jgi:hypothetical protein